MTPEESDWFDINITIPSKSMKVRWRCVDGIEDIGFYNHEKQFFVTFDPKTLSEVTHWKPLNFNDNE